MRLGPLQDFIKQKDRSIACLPIRYSPLTNHVVDRSRLEPQHLREFLNIQKPRTVRSDILAFVHHFNSGTHRFTSTTCLPPLFSHGADVNNATGRVNDKHQVILSLLDE